MIAHQLPTRMVPKVWGREALPSPFVALKGEKIGEIWFEPPAELATILVKYLFTSEKLSVQVHPSDENALSGEAGKEECWFVLDAEPNARLAIGFEREVAPNEIEEAARDGTIERLLKWHDAKAGDIFYLPAGTVHAIGPGLALVEVQQNSDTTFRLYDYGRPRELHLDRAVAVAQGTPYPTSNKSSVEQRGQTLVDERYFRLDRVQGSPNEETLAAYTGPLLVLPLEGEVRYGDDASIIAAGECLFTYEIRALDFSNSITALLVKSN